MAYMSQERKAEIAPVVKAICKKYGIKASLAVRHHSTLCLDRKSTRLNSSHIPLSRMPSSA